MIALGLWLVLLTPVFSQEAYYWCYAKHLDLSYFDHPPMMAWGIALGTALLGDSAIGLRLVTLLAALGTTWIGILWLREHRVSERGQTVFVLASIFVPGFALQHVLANPDPPLIFFWTLAFFSLWRARQGGNFGWWVLAGVATGCALLSKYTASFLGIAGVAVLLLDGRFRKQLLRPGPYVALLFACLVFLPVILWNAHTDWASFRFQSARRYEHIGAETRWITQFFGGQLLLFSPLAWLFVPKGLTRSLRAARGGDASQLWLLAFSMPLILFMSANAFLMHAKVNWVLPAYVMLLLLLVMRLDTEGFFDRNGRLFRFGRAWFYLTSVLCLAAPLLVLRPQNRGATWSGWDRIANRAAELQDRFDREDEVEGNVFYFCVDYKDAAQLTRGLRLHAKAWNPEEPVLAQNVYGGPALQFDYWDDPLDFIGEDALLVLPRPEQRQGQLRQVRAHFGKVTKVDGLAIERLGIRVLEVDVYRCEGYLGPH